MIKVFSLSLFLLCGCAKPVEVDGFSVKQSNWNKARADIVRKAVFDLSCSPEGLDVVVLDTSARWPVTVGVTGCGARVRYVRVLSLGWVASTLANEPSPDVAP